MITLSSQWKIALDQSMTFHEVLKEQRQTVIKYGLLLYMPSPPNYLLKHRTFLRVHYILLSTYVYTEL